MHVKFLKEQYPRYRTPKSKENNETKQKDWVKNEQKKNQLRH